MATLQKSAGGYIIVPGTSSAKGTSKASQYKQQKEIGELTKYAEKSGVSLPKPKLSTWQKLGRLFTSFETGDALYGSMYEDKPFLRTYATNISKGLASFVTGNDYESGDPKHTIKDILVMEGMRDRPGKIDAVDIAGLAGDIFLDPSTYVGGIIGKGIIKTFKVGGTIAKSIPVAGKVAAGLEDTARALFEPFYKIEKLGKIGKEYRSAYTAYVKSTRSMVDEFLGEVATRAKSVKGIKKAGEKIAGAIETGVQTGVKLLDDIMGEMNSWSKIMATQEAKRGILRNQLPNYMNHMLTPQAFDFLKKGGNLAQYTKPIKVKLGAAKTRTIEGIVKEINIASKESLGFELFEKDAFKAIATRGTDSLNAIKSYDFLKTTAQRFGKNVSKDFIDNDGIRWIGSTAPELKGIRLPESIAKHIDATKAVLTSDEATNTFLRTYDKALSVWKGTVTGIFPAFHTRNALGGVFNNWIAGLSNPMVYVQGEAVLAGKAGSIVTKAGKKITYDEIRTLMKEWGVIGQSGFLDVVSYLKKEINPSLARKLTTAPQKVMGAIENRIRLPLFIDGLKKGYTAEQAAKRVIKYQFDYMPEGFTGFESTIMRRLIPFYTWTRNNIPLQIEQMIMQPAKYSAVFKTQRAGGIKAGTDEESILPSWLSDRFSVKGDTGYWSGVGLPLEEAVDKLGKPLRGFATSLSPFIKTPIEVITGYKIFQERTIDEDTYGKTYKNMPGFLKSWLQMKETKSKEGVTYYTVNPHRKFWLETIGARGLATALAISNSGEDKANLWSLITTIKKYNYTPDQLEQWSTSAKKDEIEKKLYEAGLLRKFDIYYQPKQ